MISKKILATGVFTILLIVISAFVQQNKTDKPHPQNSSGNNGFAVLELFTSEGCSSCPPADELMGKIQKEWKDQPVYILAYHVDYWNHLGWKDQFSSATNSLRQQQYSRSLRSQVYTPQLVVNGKTEFVGSDEDSVEKAVHHFLNSSGAPVINLKTKVLPKALSVDYKTTKTDSRNKLLITLIEKKSVSNVARGENEGRHLTHWQIVHQQNQISLKNSPEGTTSFKIPTNFNVHNWEIIGLIQNIKTGEITGASRTSFQE